MKKKINIGLDVGVASVGWSILEEQEDNFRILDLGVRLFEDVASPKDGTLQNEKRRIARGMRRRLSRIRTRKESLKKLFIKYGLCKNYDQIDELIKIDITKFGYQIPSQLKLEGIRSKFKSDWLNKTIFSLYHYIHHRGYFWLSDDDYEKEKAKQEKNNIKNKLPSELIVNFYNNKGFYKGEEVTNISAQEWKKEIELFLKTQELDKEFSNEYIELFKTIRDFSIGPGSEKSPTPYGMYYFDNDFKKVVKRPGCNLWDATIGKCSFYKDKNRGGKNSVIANVFNFLNDLSNIFFNNNVRNRLTTEQINSILTNINNKINTSKDIKLKITPKNIMEWSFDKTIANEKLDDASGFRVNSTKNKTSVEKIITSCDNYIKIIKWIKSLNIHKFKELDFLNIDFIKEMNIIFNFYFSQKDIIKRNEEIKKYMKSTYNIECDENQFPKLSGISQTHSLSYEAMIEYIEYFKKQPGLNTLNWTQYSIHQNNQKVSNDFKNYKYIPTGLFDDAIISPTVRRSFNQTITILNKIIERYQDKYDIHHITIELARDKNTAAEAKAISDVQKLKENLNKEIKTFFNLEKDFSSSQILRYRLYKEQDGKDIYTGKFIDKDLVISGVGLEVDHIIPYSIINDDSINNKVLCFSNDNLNKKNQTPYQWLSQKGEYPSFKERVEKLNISKKKKDLLLFEGDPLSIDNQFVARNLVDTRYATVLIMDTIKNFFKNNYFYNENRPIVNVIRGSVTTFTRNNVFNDASNGLKKDRDDYRHHAIDACIVAFLGANHKINKKMSFLEKYNNTSNSNEWKREVNRLIDTKTGEVIELDSFINKGDANVLDFKRQLLEYNSPENNDVKFSRLLLTKNNVQISNETIYRVKWENQTFTKGNKITYINILEDTNKLSNYFGEKPKDVENLICYKEDKVLYNKLNSIYLNYYSNNDKINPFFAYMKENYLELSNYKESNDLNEKSNKKISFKFLKLDQHTFIKKLRVLGNNIDSNKVILLSKHKNKESNRFNVPILESLHMTQSRIYKNKNGNYIGCPINVKLLKYDHKQNKMALDNVKLQKWLEDNNVVDKEKFITLKNGTIFVNKTSNQLFYSIGSITKNQGCYRTEIKPLNRESKRYIPAITSLIKEYDICELDPLGKIYNRREIKL